MYSKNHKSRPANVLLVGAGALGCAAARTLASSAARLAQNLRLTLVDPDRVEVSNLQRQVLYRDSDVGRPKVEAAAQILAADFGATVETARLRLDEASGPALVAAHDIVIDGTDDPRTKFLLSRLCVEAGVPLVHGGVVRIGGQWMLIEPRVSACLACVFPEAAPSGNEGCASLGILAPVAGVVGSMQAITALRRLFEPGRVRAGRMFIYQLGGVRMRHVDFPPSPDCFCGSREDRNADRAGSAQSFLRRQAS
ncbi:MAG: HesA/MoeB/ThiF family protein [Deltaproteobacteria bacterium]|nr:HesA/MoeB/ThiF family protein [Deltaproteobacteria bacterium]